VRGSLGSFFHRVCDVVRKTVGPSRPYSFSRVGRGLDMGCMGAEWYESDHTGIRPRDCRPRDCDPHLGVDSALFVFDDFSHSFEWGFQEG